MRVYVSGTGVYRLGMGVYRSGMVVYGSGMRVYGLGTGVYQLGMEYTKNPAIRHDLMQPPMTRGAGPQPLEVVSDL